MILVRLEGAARLVDVDRRLAGREPETLVPHQRGVIEAVCTKEVVEQCGQDVLDALARTQEQEVVKGHAGLSQRLELHADPRLTRCTHSLYRSPSHSVGAQRLAFCCAGQAVKHQHGVAQRHRLRCLEALGGPAKVHLGQALAEVWVAAGRWACRCGAETAAARGPSLVHRNSDSTFCGDVASAAVM